MAEIIVEVALQCDQNYVDGLVSCLTGARLRLPARHGLRAFVLDCGIEPGVRLRLAETFGRKFLKVDLRFIEVAPARLERFPGANALDYLTKSSYARLLLPELLPDCPRLIYLDCDLLVDANLAELATLPLRGMPIAAVKDAGQDNLRAQLEGLVGRIEDVPIEAEGFNSGLMVMDLDVMRRENSGLAFNALLAGGEPRFADQSLFNAVFGERWLKLPPRWNRQVYLRPAFTVFRTSPNSVWHVYRRDKPWHFERANARGLIADHHRFLERAGWTPTAKPGLRLETGFWRDAIKAVHATATRSWARLAGG